jgi:signal transduction histidine kinase
MQEQIVAGLRAAVMVVDGDGVVRSGNPAASSLLGIDERAVGALLTESGLLERLSGLRGAIAEVVGGAERAVLSAATLKVEETGGERAGEAAARERKLDVMVTPFGSEPDEGEKRAALVVAEDVTEELQTKSRLIQTERLAAIGRMAAHVTHEVRSPLSSIGLNVELLEEEITSGSEETRALIAAIQREIESLRGITEEYLRVARVPSPRLEPEDLGDLARSTAQFVRPELEGYNVEIELDVAGELPPVALDESQIRQVLMNLLKNAREAMPEGGRVAVTVAPEAGGVTVRIGDQGPGMEAAQRERIFDPFYTTKDSGTGLGLPLTQQIVLAHGGRIECESAPGKGTEFTVWFPKGEEEP